MSEQNFTTACTSKCVTVLKCASLCFKCVLVCWSVYDCVSSVLQVCMTDRVSSVYDSVASVLQVCFTVLKVYMTVLQVYICDLKVDALAHTWQSPQGNSYWLWICIPPVLFLGLLVSPGPVRMQEIVACKFYLLLVFEKNNKERTIAVLELRHVMAIKYLIGIICRKKLTWKWLLWGCCSCNMSKDSNINSHMIELSK